MALPVIFAPLASLLVYASGSIARAVLLQLGIGLITYTGISTLVGTLISQARSNYDGMGSAIIQLAGLGGLGEGAGIITAAIVVKLTMSAMPRLGVLPST